ncbi:MAG: glutathione S-transferase family protein [Pseudolabrys sp.]|nr:glutathione S-transferase family protein [Pseudolabrys sp.]MBV9954796.1 glutathione S-transferase family protein [Pseudolabrys sp.]
MGLTLYVGNKNYSSWSFRPWIGMKAAGVGFDEVVIPLYAPGSAEKIRAHSPAGKVPILEDDGRVIWDSLAILEYVAEKYPEKGLWPADPIARAHARSISAEMHSGFAPLRNQCPMNMRRPAKPITLSDETRGNVARIDTLWSDCLNRYGGPFLFGAFGVADAMYAPVVSRFTTYLVGVSLAARSYMDAVKALPAWQEWEAAALKEPWTIPHAEVD